MTAGRALKSHFSLSLSLLPILPSTSRHCPSSACLPFSSLRHPSPVSSVFTAVPPISSSPAYLLHAPPLRLRRISASDRLRRREENSSLEVVALSRGPYLSLLSFRRSAALSIAVPSVVSPASSLCVRISPLLNFPSFTFYPSVDRLALVFSLPRREVLPAYSSPSSPSSFSFPVPACRHQVSISSSASCFRPFSSSSSPSSSTWPAAHSLPPSSSCARLAPPLLVTLYVTENCSLCDRALFQLCRILRILSFPFSVEHSGSTSPLVPLRSSATFVASTSCSSAAAAAKRDGENSLSSLPYTHTTNRVPSGAAAHRKCAAALDASSSTAPPCNILRQATCTPQVLSERGTAAVASPVAAAPAGSTAAPASSAAGGGPAAASSAGVASGGGRGAAAAARPAVRTEAPAAPRSAAAPAVAALASATRKHWAAAGQLEGPDADAAKRLAQHLRSCISDSSSGGFGSSSIRNQGTNSNCRNTSRSGAAEGKLGPAERVGQTAVRLVVVNLDDCLRQQQQGQQQHDRQQQEQQQQDRQQQDQQHLQEEDTAVERVRGKGEQTTNRSRLQQQEDQTQQGRESQKEKQTQQQQHWSLEDQLEWLRCHIPVIAVEGFVISSLKFHGPHVRQALLRAAARRRFFRSNI